MKSWMPTIAFMLIALWVPCAHADTQKSELGYTITLPEGWTVLKKDTIRDKPEMVEAAFKAAHDNQGLSAVPARIVSRVTELVVGGKMDYYYSPDPQFNISVYKGSGELPHSAKEVTELCNSLPEALSKETERKMNVERCELKSTSGKPAIYMVADDYWKGKKYIQYQIQTGQDEILLFTASSNKRDFMDMKDEFARVMDSLKLN